MFAVREIHGDEVALEVRLDACLNAEKPSRAYASQTLAGLPTPPRRKVGEAAPATVFDNHDVQEDDDELPSGTELVGRYRLEETIGRGGMASVYRGRHIDIGNSVAIKVMSSEVVKMEGAAARFLTEARAVATVAHPGVVRVTDFGELECGRPFMVMEHLAGRDLETLVCDRGPLTWDELEPILVQICDALGAAHEAGIVHRDVKPANIFVLVDAPEGQDVKVLDFGIAKVTDEGVRAEGDSHPQTSGLVVGTPDYMAPEQGRYGEIDLRADIYALGATAFTCLTGEPPFTAPTHPVRQILKHMHEAPPTFAEAGANVPQGVQELIWRAMAKDPDDRFQTMDEFRAALEALGSEASAAQESQAPSAARRYGFLAAAALVVAGVGFVMGGEANAEVIRLQTSVAAVIPAPAELNLPEPVVDTLEEPEPRVASDALAPVSPEVEVVYAVLEPEPKPDPDAVPEPTPSAKSKRSRGHSRPHRPQPKSTTVDRKPTTTAPNGAAPVVQEQNVHVVGAIKNPYD